MCVESVVVVVIREEVVSMRIAPAVSAPAAMLLVVFESVVTIVFVVVLVESVVELLLELSLQAATVAAIVNTAKNFFIVGWLIS